METENRLMAVNRGWGKWVKVIKRYKLSVLRQVKFWGHNEQHSDYSYPNELHERSYLQVLITRKKTLTM